MMDDNSIVITSQISVKNLVHLHFSTWMTGWMDTVYLEIFGSMSHLVPMIGRSQESSPPTSSSYLWPRRPQAPWASRRSVTLPSPCTFGFDARPAKGCVVNDGGGDGWMDGWRMPWLIHWCQTVREKFVAINLFFFMVWFFEDSRVLSRYWPFLRPFPALE